MKKYLFSILSLTAILGGAWSFSPPASAAGTYDGLEYWDIDELASLEDEVNEKIAKRCAGEKDSMCAEFVFHDLREENEKYGAYSTYANSRMYIASIQPDQKTVKFVYRNYDPRTARTTGVYKYQDLDSLFIIRYEEGTPAMDYVRAIRSGTVDSRVHVAYALDTNGHSANWFASNQEVELTLDDFKISPDIENAFWFTSMYGNTGTGDYANFSDCIKSPDYKEGTECKLVYNRERYFYLPSDTIAKNKAARQAAENPISVNTGGISDSSSSTSAGPSNATAHAGSSGTSSSSGSSTSSSLSDSSGSTNDGGTTVIYVSSTEGAADASDSDGNGEGNTDSDPSDINSNEASLSEGDNFTASDQAEGSLATPLGGESKDSSCIASFPWWFVAVVVSCDIIVMWLFWPKDRRPPKKQ